MRDKIDKAISTFFGIGYLPIMPGTYASAAGALIFLALNRYIYPYIAVTAIVTVAGFICVRQAEKLFGKPDPSEVVIDEVSGMLISYMFVPFSIFNIIIGFLIFRILDIIKIYPINAVEKVGAGRGIMLDDMLAGIMTNIILHLVIYIRGIL
jgi:phosphatidylglycerophosphatase A